MKNVIFIFIIPLFLASCQSDQKSKPIDTKTGNIHKVTVKEVIQVSEYTYLLVDENNTEKWLATPPVQAQTGETYYYEGGFEMHNFTSKELNRSFERILFLENLSKSPTHGTEEAAVSPGSVKPKEDKLEISLEACEDCITIGELYSRKKSFSGKKIKVKGIVTKFSPEIMNTNWIHIQDGTEADGKYDLTLTSDAVVNTGDTVVFEGRITLGKDLGFGYFFEILMENSIAE